MENTYTYIARSIENPEKVVTFTLLDHHMSVGLGPPMEQIETIVQQLDTDEEADEGSGQAGQAKIWLKPMAVSLLERGVGPFHLVDVNANIYGDLLRISAWYRAGGLALAPVTLVNGRVDNPQAAQGFVDELEERKSELASAFGPFKLLDFWFTWIIAGFLMVGLVQVWRRKSKS
jgi:hypothetical protein